ncbi:hypothetical protein [Cohnella luojiensis]|uniref:Collagenase n=1 Tax=Cohnella luojiensis TaxID=652876 RepID=A0A4Y8LPW6_9BACL|nr:hypothetical protein [Cohnella luojiensis]TFE23366.1 hypothetical protein E2980_19320 [Cohnella luojiensis]
MNKGELSYHGKKDVHSNYAGGMVEGINHYTLSMGVGEHINIYVTDNYELQFGKGYSYEEIGNMLESIEEKRGFKPYELPNSALEIYFYTNDSNTSLPADRQAATGAWVSNTGAGMPNEIILNGSLLYRDHRQTIVHELSHYFDNQSYFVMNKGTYCNYGGENYYFWLSEGAAEYCSCYFYPYPTNDKNNLVTFGFESKESIIRYCEQQKNGRKDVLDSIPLKSFADIVSSSNRNYGVILALYRYIADEYGITSLNSFTRYIAEKFTESSPISAWDREDTARKFFNKTEPEILGDWLAFYNYFK